MPHVRVSLFVGLVLIAGSACDRDNDRFADGAITSAFLDNTSPEAREALAIRVDYRLTDENFARWETAQRNLDRLPQSALPAAGSAGGGNVIDRAVARLESSPRARTAIESTGLTVRDFVLQTIALAQAADAAESGRPAGASLVPPENVRFVDRHRDRFRRARGAARIARRDARNDEVREQAEQGMDADSGVSGLGAASSGSASETSDDTQRTRSDTVNSDNDRRGVDPPRDTTSDSVLVQNPAD